MLAQEENLFSQVIIKKAKLNAILGQCFGLILPVTLFQSSVFILYATSLGVDKSIIMLIISLSSFFTVLQVLASFWVDSHSRKKFMSLWLAVGASFVFIAIAVPYWQENIGKDSGILLLIISVLLYVIFRNIGGTAWFPMLKDIIPSSERGRFFGILRLTWQIFVWLWILGVGFFIEDDALLWKYQLIIAIAILLNLFRTYFFMQLPEIEPNLKIKKRPIWVQIRRILRERYFQRFTLYLIGVRFFTAFALPILALFMKDLGFPDDKNILITSMYMLGSFLSYIFAGYYNDKKGSKSLFRLSQIVYVIFYIIVIFITDYSLFSSILIIIVYLFVGASDAAFGIANSSKLFQISPDNHRALYMSLVGALTSVLAGISSLGVGILIGKILPLIIWENSLIVIYSYHLLFMLSAIGLSVCFIQLKKVPKD